MRAIFIAVCAGKPVPKVPTGYLVTGTITPIEAKIAIYRANDISGVPSYNYNGEVFNPSAAGIYPQLAWSGTRLYYDAFQIVGGGEETSAGLWQAAVGVTRAEDPAANWQPVGGSGATGIPIFTPQYEPIADPGTWFMGTADGQMIYSNDDKIIQARTET